MKTFKTTEIEKFYFVDYEKVMSFTPEKDIDGITYGQVKELSSEEIIFLLNEKQSVQNTPKIGPSESIDSKGSGFSDSSVH